MARRRMPGGAADDAGAEELGARRWFNLWSFAATFAARARASRWRLGVIELGNMRRLFEAHARAREPLPRRPASFGTCQCRRSAASDALNAGTTNSPAAVESAPAATAVPPP